MKIREVRAELFHADRQAARRSHFAKAHKNNPDKSYIPLNPFTRPRNVSKILLSSDLHNEMQ